jgi:thiol:disulfide interchange protein DsbD
VKRLSHPPGGPARSLRPIALLSFLAAFLWLQLPVSPAGPPVEWRTDLETALDEAAAEGRPAILSFHARWCSVCRRLDARSLRAPEVAAELERFVRVRVDASASNEATAELLRRFDVPSLPALLFVDPGAGLLAEPRVLGYAPREELIRVLRGIEVAPGTGGAVGPVRGGERGPAGGTAAGFAVPRSASVR